MIPHLASVTETQRFLRDAPLMRLVVLWTVCGPLVCEDPLFIQITIKLLEAASAVVPGSVVGRVVLDDIGSQAKSSQARFIALLNGTKVSMHLRPSRTQ